MLQFFDLNSFGVTRNRFKCFPLTCGKLSDISDSFPNVFWRCLQAVVITDYSPNPPDRFLLFPLVF